MPARLRDAISGILAGGIPGFGTATFLLGTSRSSLICLALNCCFKDDLLRTGHISCLVITFHRCFLDMSFHFVMFWFLWCFCAFLCCFFVVLLLACVGLVAVFFFSRRGMVSY